MLLELQDIQVHYNKVAALKGISLKVEEGDMITLIGSNGAGKSTTLRTISGLVHPSVGQIHFKGQRIDRLSPDKVLKLGIAHVPEGRRIFPGLTAIENLRLGAFIRKDKQAVERDLERVLDHFPRLRERVQQLASTMSGGEQQMLSIGRALMSKPKLLLLDEPSLGLAPVIVKHIKEIISEINREHGVAVVLVEQNAELALDLSRYGYVLETGSIAIEGEAKGLMGNEHVRRAYLGL